MKPVYYYDRQGREWNQSIIMTGKEENETSL